MDRKALEEKIKSKARDGKIACAQALKLAEEAGVTSREVGDTLNALKIKIVGCQLGCFE